VAEGIFQLGQPGSLADQIGVLQGVQLPLKFALRSLAVSGNPLQDAVGERTADDGGQLQDAAHFIFQAVHSGSEQRQQISGNVDGRLRIAGPPA
jgi:hypothetical protein